MKSELITWLAGLAENDPRLQRIDEIRRGDRPEREERHFSLKEISRHELVRKHAVWLHRLQVPTHCGEYVAGRRAYRLSRVLDYLKSDRCRARIAELNAERKRRAIPNPQPTGSP